jgi:hypothetical protein
VSTLPLDRTTKGGIMPLCPEGYRKKVEAMGWTKEVKKLAMERFRLDGMFYTENCNPVLQECVQDGLATVSTLTGGRFSGKLTYVYKVTKSGVAFLNPG